MAEAVTYTNNCTTADITLESIKAAMAKATVMRAEMARFPEWIEIPPSTQVAIENHPLVRQERFTMPPDAFGQRLYGLRLERDYTMPPMSWRECWQGEKRVMHYADGRVIRCLVETPPPAAASCGGG